MQKSTAPNASFDDANPPDGSRQQPVVGDADAVQKTTWVVGKGTDDRADRIAPLDPDEGKQGEVNAEERTPPPRRGTSGLP
jgi:hypothetical protein